MCNQSNGYCLACVEGRTGLLCEDKVSSESQVFGKWYREYEYFIKKSSINSSKSEKLTWITLNHSIMKV